MVSDWSLIGGAGLYVTLMVWALALTLFVVQRYFVMPFPAVGVYAPGGEHYVAMPVHDVGLSCETAAADIGFCIVYDNLLNRVRCCAGYRYELVVDLFGFSVPVDMYQRDVGI